MTPKAEARAVVITPELRDAMMELYVEGLQDGQIARRLGLPKTTVWRWRESEGLPAHKRPDTLCWNCKFAYGNKCFSVPFERRKWVKKFIAWKSGRIVFECDRFKPEEGVLDAD